MTPTAAANLSLWDAEDLDVMPAVREMTVGPASTEDVREFARRYHYTGLGNSATWRWGLWHGVTLLGVVSYNLPTQRTCASVFGPTHAHRVWHMGRLILADAAPRNSESRLIGGSLRAIRRDFPDVWAVVTFAASDVGHVGYVYQATNAIYTGTGGYSAYFLDANGDRRGTLLHGWVSRERAQALGWTRHEDGVKHRYVYVLGTKGQRAARIRQLRLPVLPYPKGVD
jgi:hypothetical protein